MPRVEWNKQALNAKLEHIECPALGFIRWCAGRLRSR